MKTSILGYFLVTVEREDSILGSDINTLDINMSKIGLL